VIEARVKRVGSIHRLTDKKEASMTDPIRHEMISFLTKNEAEQFIIALKTTFGEFVFSDITIEHSDDFNRHEVIVSCKRLRLPKRMIAFVIGWACATTFHNESREASILVPEADSRDLKLYR
jgi:hypothetical protein